MPNATLSDETNARLQALATPLVDTHDSVIARLLDHWERTQNHAPKLFKPGEPTKTLSDGKMLFDPANLPNLGFTTPKKMVLDGIVLPKSDTNWNAFLIQTIRRVHEGGASAEDILAKLQIANAQLGMKNDNGYKFLPDVGLSLQGQDSNAAFRQTYELAAAFGVSGSVFFIWQDKEKAAYPNMAGIIEF